MSTRPVCSRPSPRRKTDNQFCNAIPIRLRRIRGYENVVSRLALTLILLRRTEVFQFFPLPLPCPSLNRPDLRDVATDGLAVFFDDYEKVINESRRGHTRLDVDVHARTCVSYTLAIICLGIVSIAARLCVAYARRLDTKERVEEK